MIVATIRSVNRSDDGPLATILSVIVLIIGATAVFTALQDAMNRGGLVAFFLMHYGGFWVVHGLFVFGLFVVGILLAGGGLALLAGSLRARVPTAVLALVTAAGAAAGGVAIVLRGPSDLVLALSLFGLALGLLVSELILLRPRA